MPYVNSDGTPMEEGAPTPAQFGVDGGLLQKTEVVAEPVRADEVDPAVPPQEPAEAPIVGDGPLPEVEVKPVDAEATPESEPLADETGEEELAPGV